MNYTQRAASQEDDATDLRALLQMVLRYKAVIALMTFLGGLVGVIVALTTTPIYRAQVVVTEVRDAGIAGAASSLANQLGGLASVVGLNLSPDAGAGQEAQALLASRRLAEEFVKRKELLPTLSRDSSPPLTLWRAIEGFREGIVSVRQDRRNAITTIAIEWTDPIVASEWANAYVALANELIRTRALEDSTRNIEYLNEQIANTNVVEIQRVMYNLIESEMQTLMLASARHEYAFTIIDPAVAPELRIRPNRRMIAVTGAALGFMFGIAGAIALNMVRKHRSSRRPASAATAESAS